VEVVASLSQGRTAAAQCGLFTYKSVPVIFEPHCTYNATLRGVHATIVTVENDNYYVFWMCVCSLRYPACNAHGPYVNLWPARLYIILPYYLINGTIFGRKWLNIKYVFSLQLRNISHSKKKWARCDPKFILIFMYCNRYCTQILIKL